jgi:hypothetical protein
MDEVVNLIVEGGEGRSEGAKIREREIVGPGVFLKTIIHTINRNRRTIETPTPSRADSADSEIAPLMRTCLKRKKNRSEDDSKKKEEGLER